MTRRVLRWLAMVSLIAVSVVGTATAALLEVAPQLPRFFYDADGTTNYDPGTGMFEINSFPLALFDASVAPFSVPVTDSTTAGPRSVIARVQLDTSGSVVGGVAGADLTIVGRVTVNGTTYDGLLLSGEITGFGFLDTATTTDRFDLRATLTGGQMAGLYPAGSDIGITVTTENSTFANSFTVAFFGSPTKGDIGPIPMGCTGRIGDYVWQDDNLNGIQDAGENGISGATVNLYDAAGVVLLDSVTTGANGDYLFTDVCAGTYTVDVVEATLPSNLQTPTDPLQGGSTLLDSNGPANGGGASVTLPSDSASDLSIDFGYISPCTGRIGDLVWHDANRDGIQGSAALEPGLANVQVLLRDGANVLVGDTTTDMNGFYEFNGLCADNYSVDVVEATLPSNLQTPTDPLQGADPTVDSNGPSDGGSAFVSLPTNDSEDITIDFGYIAPCTGTLGDFVWYDANRDGIQQAGETGIANATVVLRDSTGALVGSTLTGLDGFYQFTGLCADTYTVDVDETTLPPTMQTPTDPLQGGDPAFDSNGPLDGGPATVTLPTDDSDDPTIDFGYISPCTGRIGDFVWNDVNRDGIQDAGEPGLSGVQVLLRDGNGVQVAMTSTASNGFYEFPGLCADTYSVDVVEATLPANLQTPTDPFQGADPALDSNGPLNGGAATVVLPTDDSEDITIDFGYISPCTGSLGDYVWHDANRDGIQQVGETGLVGVLVTLRDGAGGFLADTLTVANGFYQFTGLCAGDYTVDVDESTLPANLQTPTDPFQGGDSATDSNGPLDGGPAPVSLPTDNSNDPTIDFGYISPCTGRIGDFVWNDMNRDGIQQANEPGIDGASVILRTAGGQFVSNTISGPNGFYEFTGLCADDYTVDVDENTLPAALRTPSDPFQGGDTTTDSNGPLDGGPAPVSLPTDNSEDVTIDFGYNSPCTGSIGDFVWMDSNGNGIQDNGEAGVFNVTVLLRDAVTNALVATDMTDGAGAYLFTGLCAGNYRVSVDPTTVPAGLQVTLINAPGSNTANDSDDPNGTAVSLPTDNSSNLTLDFGYVAQMGGIDIEKATNGQDADTPTGPIVAVGSTVTWTYVVTNTGNVTITGIVVSDDQGVSVTCPATSLAAGASMSCTASGIAQAGQYANIGTVNGNANGTPVSDSDPSHYFGSQPAIDIEKATNGQDADNPTGPMVNVGSVVNWTYVITNIGNVDLSNIIVTDNQGVAVSCPGSSLAVGASMTCTGSGVAQAGQYSNLGSVTGTSPNGQTVSDSDPSHYFGTQPGIDIEKATNGQDADTPTGPFVAVGSTVTWTYVVTNTGTATITNIVVSDDQGVNVSCPSSSLAAGSSMTCIATGIAQAGQYSNIGTVTGSANGTPVTDNDPSHYFGAMPSIDIEKATNGQDADSPTGPIVTVGSVVNWTYVVTNTGNVTLSNVQVADNRGVNVSCPSSSLTAGAAMTCTGTGIAQAGQYANIGSVSGTSPNGQTVSDSDPSHYFGAAPAIAIEKATNGEDADTPTGPVVTVGSTVTWTYVVSNIGNVPLSNVAVSDDQGVSVACPSTTLAVGASMTCTGSGIAQAGQYANIGSVTGIAPNGQTVSDSDPSHYFGQALANSALGDFVWIDADRNGLQDGGDVGLDGVVVNLLDGNGQQLATQTTANGGKYLFDNLTAGTYEVEFVLPNGYNFTAPNQGGNDAVDSDANLVTGRTGPIVLGTGQTDLRWDAGVFVGDKDAICLPTFDMEFDAEGTMLVAGQIIDNEWAAYGVTVTTSDPVNHPAMIFDSANPTGGDLDLGTPNQDFGGPGVGTGGKAGTIGANSQAQGKVLIISEDANSANPDDNAGGGMLIFSFAQAVRLDSLGILDIEEAGGSVQAFDASGALIASVPLQTYGDNSFQRVALNAMGVSTLKITFTGSGAVTDLSYCIDDVTPGIDIRKQEEGPDTRAFTAGSDVPFQIVVTNTGDVALSNVQVSDPLAPQCDATIGSLAIGASQSYSCTVTLSGGATTTKLFKDNFSQFSYNNNDGPDAWTGPWTEYDVAGAGPTSGNVLVGSNYKLWLDDNPDTGTQPSAARTADLSGMDTATLSFDYETHSGVDTNDAVVVEISSDGGASYTVLETFTGFSGAKYGSRSYDVSAYISSQTTIRFRVSQNYGGASETFKVDNVKLAGEGTGGTSGFTNEACVVGTAPSGTVDDCDTSTVTVSTGPSCTTCQTVITAMTLKITAGASNRPADERVRVRENGLGGQVLYDSFNDGDSSPTVPTGGSFSFDIAHPGTPIVVTVQGANHPYEYVKANFATDCSTKIGDTSGNSYITFKVTAADTDGGVPICEAAGGGHHSGTYFWAKLKSAHSGKCLDISGGDTGDGANAQQWGCYSGGMNQKVKFEPVDGKTDVYTLKFAHSGKCLDVYGNGMSNGDTMIQWNCHGGLNQQFKVTDRGYGKFSLTAQSSGKCMDVAGVSYSDGADVQQWSYGGANNQLWYIEDEPEARNALFVVGSTALNASDASAKSRLEGLGFTVTVKDDAAVTTADGDGMALIVISSTVNSGYVGTKFRNSPVPVITWEVYLYDDLGMTGGSAGYDFGVSGSQYKLSVVGGHSMCAGLSGTQQVLNAYEDMAWGKPASSAVNIATIYGSSTKKAIFGYESGAYMKTMNAPARRVGMFLYNNSADNMVGNGQSLFDAAVDWATGQ